MQMQREGKNMADVRNDLEVKSIRWKVEKKILEWIEHVLRMDDEQMTKGIGLGWMEELEKWEKKPGITRKTVAYWKKLLGEARIDYTEIGKRTSDRKEAGVMLIQPWTG